MKRSRPSIAAGFALLVAAPLVAQDRGISQSIEVEARRLALAPSPPHSAGQPTGDWARIMRLAAGADITLLVDGRAATLRASFLSADGDALVVLNVAPLASRGAQRTLLDFASRYPETVARPNDLIQVHDVQVGPDGVFVKRQRIAARDDVVVAIARRDVAQITTPQVDGAAAAGVAGAIGGFFFGALIGNALTRNCGCDDPGLAGMVFGAPIGAVAGGWFGASRVKPHDVVIYRRP